MTQLVFVHGVYVRKLGNNNNSNDYDKGVQERHEAFQGMGLGGASVDFYDPYWGEHGATPPENSLKFRSPSWLIPPVAPLGPGDGYDLQGTNLIDAAEDDFAATVDALCEILYNSEGNLSNPDLAIQIADYIADLEDSDGNVQAPSWMDATDPLRPTNDQEFLRLLEQQSRHISTLAVANPQLQEIAKKEAGPISLLVSRWLAGKVREFTPVLAVFLGDAFVYLNRTTRFRKIREVIRDDLIKAAKKARDIDDNLILVCHSMGANILYDMLTDSREVRKIQAGIGGRLTIDLFLTVGTQVGLFQEQHLFTLESQAVFPDSCKRWWHVYNDIDVLSFAALNIFPGTTDGRKLEQYSCNTRTNIFDAHTAYFTSPIFQRRLYKRLKKEGLAS